MRMDIQGIFPGAQSRGDIHGFCLEEIHIYAPTPETKDIKVYKFGEFRENEYTVLEDGTAEIRRYHEGKCNLTIPEEIDGYRVTKIREGAFRNHYALQDVMI